MRSSSAFDCAIAAKSVTIQPRSGQYLGESGRPYIRCSERDCQYVDRNEAPCPLRLDMVAETADFRALREHVASRPGRRLCYGCLVAAVGLTHDGLRRLTWQLRAEAGAEIRPGRCVGCRQRRLTISIPADRVREIAPPPEPQTARAVDDRVRVLAARATLAGMPACPACIALASQLPLSDSRRAIDDLASHGAVSIDPDGTCGICGRRQAVIAA